MPNPIPPEHRDLVEVRSRGLCEFCGMRGAEMHHRRSRRVRDEHTHCPCNLILLCQSDHAEAHGYRNEPKQSGLIISQWQTEPSSVPVELVTGSWWPDCQGGWSFRIHERTEHI